MESNINKNILCLETSDSFGRTWFDLHAGIDQTSFPTLVAFIQQDKSIQYEQPLSGTSFPI